VEKRPLVEGIIEKNKEKPDALVQVLKEVHTLLGYLPDKLLEYIAEGLDIPPVDVRTVASIYPGFIMESETGGEEATRHKLCVCKGTSCYIRGANEILGRICKKLNIKPGETTPDGNFSLDVVRCVSACALGPVITIDGDVHPRTNPGKVSKILDNYRE